MRSVNSTLRLVRSFVKRGGRTTAAQSKALEDLWPAFGVDSGTQTIEPDVLFGRLAPLTLEIGFGDGEALIHRAMNEPDRDFLGIEVHPPGVGHCLMLAEAQGLKNLKVMRQDAVEVLKQRLPDACLDEVLIWFPDPWHKKRHFKRRLLQEEFASLVASRLSSTGRLRFGTDWQPYAEHALQVLSEHASYRNASPDGTYVTRPSDRLLTKFERRGLRLGHGVWDLEFIRI